MKRYILQFDKKFLDLEDANLESDAVEYVYWRWKNAPMSIDRLLCAGVALWHAIRVYDYDIHNPSFERCADVQYEDNLYGRLMEVTKWGMNFFSDDPSFNVYFGYLIEVMPYFFLDYGGDYDGWRQKGRDMIRHAHALDPNSVFVQAMLFRNECTDLFEDACVRLWMHVTPKQWGNSGFQQYLFYILNGNIAYGDPYDDV